MNLTFDPPEDATWTLSGAAEINGNRGFYSPPNALYLFARRLPGGSTTRSDAVIARAVVPGDALPILVLLKGEESNTIRFTLKLDDGVAPITYTLLVPTGTGFLPWEPGTYWPASPTLTITLSAIPPTSLPGGSFGIGGHWLVDNLNLGAPIDENEMSKRREIREAIVTAIRTVNTANGYSLNVGSVVAGSEGEREVESFPHVQVQHGEEIKSVRTLQRKDCTLSLTVDVFCEEGPAGDAEDQCDDACGEIEKAVELFENGQWLALGYVQNVFVRDINPMEMPESVARTLRMWSMTVDVTYSHERRNP